MQAFYAYDANNNRTNQFVQKWQNSVWENWYQYNLTYDVNNNKTSFVAQNWENSAWLNNDSLHFYYSNTITGINATVKYALFSIFPNPSSGIFTVQLKNKTVDTKIRVYDMWGNYLLGKVFMSNTIEEIDLTFLPKGIYYIELITNGKKSVKKIILN